MRLSMLMRVSGRTPSKKNSTAAECWPTCAAGTPSVSLILTPTLTLTLTHLRRGHRIRGARRLDDRRQLVPARAAALHENEQLVAVTGDYLSQRRDSSKSNHEPKSTKSWIPGTKRASMWNIYTSFPRLGKPRSTSLVPSMPWSSRSCRKQHMSPASDGVDRVYIIWAWVHETTMSSA